MRTTWGTVILVACLVTCALLVAQSDAGWAGSWAGDWSGDGGSGALRLKLEKGPEGGAPWTGKADFSLSGADVPAVVKTLKIDGESLEMTYEFDLQGYKLVSALSGKRKDRTLEGTYKTTAAADGSPVDAGKWKLTLK